MSDNIVMNLFKPRPYQREIFEAIDKGYKKIIAVWPRRAGKDITAWNIAITQCIKRICLVQYVLPTFGQARRAIFDAISSDGIRFLDYIPPQLVDKVNVSEQKIVFKNGSVLQCLGGDVHDTSIRGTNPYLVVLSEYAYMDGAVYDTVRPILAANGGTIIFLSTPYGKNHFWQMIQAVELLDDWKVIKRTTSEIKHIPQHILDQERAQMSPELYAQEYDISFERGVSGSVFGTCLDDIKKKGQVTSVSWDPPLLVYVAIDIGVNDPTTMVFFQVVGDGTIIRVIDCYSNRNVGLDHYAKILQSKPYRYGKYFAPADLMVREWGGGAITRYEKAKQLDINFTILEQLSLEDSIENVMANFPKIWIDANNCKSLINALENYYKEWDEQKQIYKPKPVHNWSSHYVDAFRYMCQAIYKTKMGLSSQEFERKKLEALYGPNRFLNNPWANR